MNEELMNQLLDLLEESAKEGAETRFQSCYDLYCDILNKKINPFHALLTAYELGKNRMKADIGFLKDDKLNK